MQRTTTYAPAHCFSNYFTIIAVSIQWLITFTTRDKKQIRKLTKSLDGGLAPNTLLVRQKLNIHGSCGEQREERRRMSSLAN